MKLIKEELIDIMYESRDGLNAGLTAFSLWGLGKIGFSSEVFEVAALDFKAGLRCLDGQG